MTADNSNIALQIDNLKYTYVQEWTRKKMPALKGINLEVFKGESFGFLGHNGAGKTTTIKCILGLIKPPIGDIKIFGKSFRETSSRVALGYLPEQPYFYDYLSVSEIMEMYACLAGVQKGERASCIAKALGLVKLSSRTKSSVRSLSKGLTQRLAMAQAIVGSPRLLVLDEPFSGLDPIGRKDFRELLVELKSDGVTIFMSSHILSDVEFLCDRVSIMAYGEIKGIFDLRNCPELDSGRFELVLRHSEESEKLMANRGERTIIENRFLRIEFSDRQHAEEALAVALTNKIGVESFEFLHGNLEDLFVKLVNFEEQHGN